MSGPSDKAIEAADNALWHPFKSQYETVTEAAEAVRAMAVVSLRAAYPIIREDVIREVVEALRGEWAQGRLSNYATQQDAADFIEREFGAER